MNKPLSLFLIATLFISFITFAEASEFSDNEVDGPDTFCFAAAVNDKITDYISVTSYEQSSDWNDIDHEQKIVTIKSVLKDLGMREKNIELLNEDALQSLITAKRITLSTCYTKTDQWGHTEYVSPEEALNAAKVEQEKLELLAASQTGNGVRTSNVSSYFQDFYMRIDYTVSYQGNGQYLFMVDSEWLTMPAFRGRDSLGACAMNGTVVPGSRYGYYYYTYTESDYTGATSSDIVLQEIASDYTNAINGNWYGSACSFVLPNDYNNDDSSLYCYDFCAHFQYRGYVTAPAAPANFNTVGSYSHRKFSIDLSPSITISFSTYLSASIGFNSTPILNSVDVRGVELLIQYTPD